MSTDGELSPLVRDLVRGPIDSIDQVQILSAMAGQPTRHWTTTEVAQATSLSPSLVESTLRGLAQARLIGRLAEADDERFLDGALTVTTRGAVAELLHMYNTRPVTLIRAIYARVPARRTFSDEIPSPREGNERS